MFEPWFSRLLEPWFSSIACGISDGPVAASERPQAVVKAEMTRLAAAIRLKERRDMGIPLRERFRSGDTVNLGRGAFPI